MNRYREYENLTNGIKKVLPEIITVCDIPNGSVYLAENCGKEDRSGKRSISSISVNIWEPSYPFLPNEKQGKNDVAIIITANRLKNGEERFVLSIKDVQAAATEEYLPENTVLLNRTAADNASETQRIEFRTASPEIIEYIKRNIIWRVNTYVSKTAKFGCCALFVACSDAKKCVHENRLYSTGCAYRKNLDSGLIFYGKNRNID